jgi:hypothetical protein
MTQRGRRTEAEKAEETLVISETEHGYRVYAPSDPKRSYIVTRDEEEGLRCSCGEYLRRSNADPDWQCPHIAAVVSRMSGEETNGARDTERYDTEERRAIQDDGRKPQRKKAVASPNGSTQMIVKRSVSPDGRIDSLSVEFAAAVETIAADEIKAKAKQILAVQADIMQDFLGRNGKAETPRPTPSQEMGPAVPARLLRIDGMDGKWGRRLFIMVQVNGETTRLFGNRKQLAEALEAAGFPRAPETITEGTELNLPCRVTTKPSPDGRFVNIDRVSPANIPRTHARVR